jgi:hypothetical protein
MPKAQIQGKTAELLALVRQPEEFHSETPWHYTGERGANLPQILLQKGVDLYNNDAKVVDYWNLGSCDPCAVLLEGKVSIAQAQKTRRSLPPHSSVILGA